MKKLLLVIMATTMLIFNSCGKALDSAKVSGGAPDTSAESADNLTADTSDAESRNIDDTSQGEVTESGEYISDAKKEQIKVRNFPALEEVQEKYPDKTVLVWCLPDFYRTELEVNAKVNDYLDSLGKDYAVYFKLLKYTSADGDYIDLVKKRISDGEPVDILYSAEITEDSAMTFSYHSYVLEGLYEPLDGYFSNTEIGRKLYNQMPENYWRLLNVDGMIYAADGNSGNYSYPSGYCVNKELAQKYGFDVYKPVTEQLDVLEKVKNGESNCDIVFFPAKMGKSAYYPEVFESLNGIVYDRDSDRLVRLTEDKVFLNRLSEINTLARAWYVNSSNNARAKSFFVSYAVTDAIAAGNIGTEAFRYHADDKPIEVLNVYSTDKVSFKVPNTATGVCSHSGNKDMAFDLLATVMTDGSLNDLLTGNGSRNFSQTSDDKFKNEAVSSITNPDIADGTYYNELYLHELENAQLPPYIGFTFDVLPVSEQYKKVKNVITSYDFVQNKELSEILDDVNQRLNEAGIDDVLSEVNRQYNEWKENVQ